MTFDEILCRYQWRPIPACPGRFVLETPKPEISPEQLAGVDQPPVEFRVATAKDAVQVVCLHEGGLISYRRPDHTFYHTLNDHSGFIRKLDQLGIERSDIPGLAR